MLHPKHQQAVDLLKQSKFKEALKIMNDLVKKHPENPDFVSERGVIYYHLEKKEYSIKDMNHSVALQPDYAYRYTSRAYIRDWIGDLHGAIADYEKAITLDPEDATAYNNLGMLQEKLGYKGKATDYYKRADKLAGIEKDLHKVIEQEENQKPLPEIKPVSNKEKTKEASSKETIGSVAKSVFTDKSERKAFFKFIRNGFKIK